MSVDFDYYLAKRAARECHTTVGSGSLRKEAAIGLLSDSSELEKFRCNDVTGAEIPLFFRWLLNKVHGVRFRKHEL